MNFIAIKWGGVWPTMDEQSTLYRAVFQATPNPICLVRLQDPGTEPLAPVVISVNPAFQSRHGDRPFAEAPFPLHHLEPELVTDFGPALRGAVADQRASTFEVHNAGLDRWDSVSVFPGEEGQAVVLFVDVREKKVQERQAFEEGLKFRTFFELGSVKLVIDLPTKRILEANQPAVDFYGWTHDELCRMRISDINVADPMDTRTNMELANAGRQMVFHFRHRTKAGEVRDVEVHSVPGYWGNSLALFSIIFDKTTEVQLGTRLAQKESLARVGFLTSSLIHEVGNILGALRSTLGLLFLREGLGRLEKERLLLDRQFDRAKSLTTALKGLSLNKEIARGSVACHELLEEVLAIERASLLQKGITLEYQKPLDHDMVFVNESLIFQVFLNVMTNAVQSLDGTPQPRLSVKVCVNGDKVYVAFSNNGPPIDPVVEARLFVETVTTKAEGTGLGLSFARMAMELHNGAIELYSSDPVTFVVSLPVQGRSSSAWGASTKAWRA